MSQLDHLFEDFLKPGGHPTLVHDNPSEEELFALLSSIPDPEIPVINIAELGILRSVEKTSEGYIIRFTPTYTGCPAMGMIEMQIRAILDDAGVKNYKLESVLSPAWTTDWIQEDARQKLKNYGIAPPLVQQRIIQLFEGQGPVACPRCNSLHTEMISEFGSTACKSQYRCLDCKEPFDYFKCH